MKIVWCDFHPGHQQGAVLDTVTGEVKEMKLLHVEGEAERFYREMEAPALVGMESVGNSLWFEQMVERLGHQLWVGDAAQIRASGACPELAEGFASRRPTSAMRAIF